MAFRIGELVVRGELKNSRRNFVFGWLEFGDEHGIRLELTGNLSGDLAGRDLQFEVPHEPAVEDAVREAADELELQQIGVVGSMELRMAKIPDAPIGEFYRHAKLDEPLPVAEKPVLALEWHSQNGRMVAEIVDPVITFHTDKHAEEFNATPEPLPDADGSNPDGSDAGPSIIGYSLDEHGNVDELRYAEPDSSPGEDDPYDLFPVDLEAQLHQPGHEFDEPAAEKRRPWDEVIPGIDEEIKRMYEQWDEVVYGEKDEPLATLFDPPITLKPPQEIADEAEAAAWLKLLLAQFALHWVAVDVCKHFTALDTYRWLVEHILPDAEIHPRLGNTGFIQHYSTWESCPHCEAELDAEFEQRKSHERDESEDE